jgi:hypothetical protein
MPAETNDNLNEKLIFINPKISQGYSTQIRREENAAAITLGSRFPAKGGPVVRLCAARDALLVQDASLRAQDRQNRIG